MQTQLVILILFTVFQTLKNDRSYGSRLVVVIDHEASELCHVEIKLEPLAGIQSLPIANDADASSSQA